jgi:hypothetical protein
MSATGEWFAEHIEKLENWAKSLLGHEDPAVKAVGEDVEKTVTELKADTGEVEREAESAGVTAAHEAETAAEPVAETAVHDAETVAEQAAADAASVAEAAVPSAPAAEASTSTEPA